MVDSANATTFTLASDREIVMSRFFDAPRDLVWKAWMDPTASHGGARAPNDGETPGYLEIVEPERIVRAFRMPGATEDSLVTETVTFESHGGRTKVTAASRFDSKEDRDTLRQESTDSSRIERVVDRLRAMI